MFRKAAVSIACLLMLAGCVVQDPARLAAMSNNGLIDQWHDWKSEKALNELVNRGLIKQEQLADIKAEKIWLGMPEASLFVSRGIRWPEYSDSSGATVYRYGGTYVQTNGVEVTDWWYVSQ